MAIDDGMDAANIAHAFGGAIALGFYAIPRTTIDVDVNVFISPDAWQRVADALAPLGVTTDTDALALERDGWIRWWWGRNPIDVFFAYDPFHDAIRRGTRNLPLADHPLPVMSPEHLLVCKVVFDRNKDWPDIEAMLVSTAGIDVAEVRRWLDHLVGPDDQRRRHFDEVAAAILGE
jgi:hypothetical protein